MSAQKDFLLQVSGLKAFYGDLQVLWDINCSVRRGEVVAIIGANGSGKTTLLRCIAGLQEQFHGEIVYKGCDITKTPSFQRVSRNIVLVPEERGLFPEMTVLENLLMGAFSIKSREEIEKSLRWIYEIFPVLSKRKYQIAGSLSGGQQQMLAIGRGLISRPHLLMMDEPSLGIAPVLVSRMFEVFQEINQAGVAMLLVEQNVYRILSVADRAYVLENGCIVNQGIAKELLESEQIKKAYLGM